MPRHATMHEEIQFRLSSHYIIAETVHRPSMPQSICYCLTKCYELRSHTHEQLQPKHPAGSYNDATECSSLGVTHTSSCNQNIQLAHTMTPLNVRCFSFDGVEQHDRSLRINVEETCINCRHRRGKKVVLRTVTGRRRAAHDHGICTHGHKRGWTAQAAVIVVPRRYPY